LKTLFHIGPEEQQGGPLLMEVGTDHCTYAFLSPDRRSITQLKYISFDPFNAAEALQSIMEQLGQPGSDVAISSAFPQALLVPQRIYQENDHSLLDLVYDAQAQQYHHDSIPEWQMVNVYGIPQPVFEALSRQFSSARFYHVYTTTLKVYNGFMAENQVSVHFTTREFRVMVKKGQQVHLAQTYQYTTPLDVVYYLLKICYEFALEQSEVTIILSGLVENDSALYREIHQYFSEVHFSQAQGLTLPENPHPRYFFSSLYNLAACVS
jgi:hypothetical protein